jgi:hypothetical protein
MAGLAIGGLVINQMWLLAIATGLVTVAAVAIRLGWRRGKSVSDR